MPACRVFFYLEDRERTLDTALDKVMLSLTSFAAEMEREKAKQRTHDAMLRKAKAGHVTGCKVFGYDNIDVLAADGHRVHVTRKINEAEAAIVREIFQQFAAGLGLKTIAKRLTARHVVPPRHGRHGWCHTALREIIHRELYRGVIIWNRTQTVQRGGTRTQRQRPESEWLRIDAPELRIVPEDLWQLVHERVQQRQKSYLRSGRTTGRPAFG
jgi:site-specific DNA recombinase